MRNRYIWKTETRSWVVTQSVIAFQWDGSNDISVSSTEREVFFLSESIQVAIYVYHFGDKSFSKIDSLITICVLSKFKMWFTSQEWTNTNEFAFVLWSRILGRSSLFSSPMYVAVCEERIILYNAFVWNIYWVWSFPSFTTLISLWLFRRTMRVWHFWVLGKNPFSSERGRVNRFISLLSLQVRALLLPYRIIPNLWCMHF